ncbi:protein DETOXIFICATION 24-like [Macadamia integrifolia]|uniref:protein DETOXIFICATION 24-like n=1 Tax=Macadamia integrifolia TaxID=60698 RepID=UPI001C5000D4|nr:protein DETOXIFICATION 24-like [Macadamia integrifolia]XP_042513204.1 protein DETOXIFICATION 24-like [Macadamia integrifolia]
MENGITERLLDSNKKDEENLKSRTWDEVKKLWGIGAPSILARVSSFGILVVTQAYMGHIGEIELASFSLVQAINMRFVDGILYGLGSALPTLCGQAFGARQYHMLGIYLQQSWIILLTISIFLVPVFIFTTPILRLLGEAEELSISAGKLSPWFLPVLFYHLLGLSTQMYLQAQLKIMVVGWISAISFVINIILSWLMVDKLNWGVPGAMGAMTLSICFISISDFIYVFGGWCKDSWKGFSKRAFNELWPVVKLSISSGMMLCFEVWTGALLILLVGYMKNAKVEVSAFSICLNIIAWVYMISMGFSGAACVRVANELGKGDALAAKFSIKVNLSISLTIGVIFSILALVFSETISYAFTSSSEVAKEVSSLSILLASVILLNSFQPVLSGVAIGAGWQSLVANVNLLCLYIIGFPLAIFLGYVIHLQVRGVWMGMICGVAAQTLVLAYITWTTDWDAQVDKTAARLNHWILPPS